MPNNFKANKMLSEILESADDKSRDILVAGFGASLTDRDTRRLLKRILERPEDLITRWTLVGARQLSIPKSEELLAQLVSNLIWLIEHHPTSIGHQQVLLGFPLPIFAKVKSAWKNALRKHPKNAVVASNAGHPFVLIDKAFAVRCFKKSVEISPADADGWQRLSHLYSLHVLREDGTSDRSTARKSVEALRRAMKCPNSRKDSYVAQYRTMLLVDAAGMALKHEILDEGEALGKQLIKLPRSGAEKSDQPQAIRQHSARDIGNAILGLVALKRGKIDASVRHLGRIEGAVTSQDLVLSLANNLIRKRKHAAVNLYLQRCQECMATFPESEDKSATLAGWRTILTGGRAVKLKPW